MHSRSTLGFLKVWEQMNNPDFKVLQEQDFKGWEQVEREFIAIVSLCTPPNGWTTPMQLVSK